MRLSGFFLRRALAPTTKKSRFSLADLRKKALDVVKKIAVCGAAATALWAQPCVGV
jgi:hypothetical protein